MEIRNVDQYERPEIVDLGTIAEVTEGSALINEPEPDTTGVRPFFPMDEF